MKLFQNSSVLDALFDSPIGLSLLLNLIILVNYIGWWFGLGSVVAPFVILGLATLILFGFLQSLATNRWLVPVYLLIFVLLLSASGSPSVDWDARSIWLFHAKRIVLENNLFAQFDNYAEWSHNDYPTMIPSLSASLALTIGGWNELLPKASGVFALLSPLLIISNALRSPIRIMLFLIGLVALDMKKHMLFNGYMDLILGIYALAIFVILAIGTSRNDTRKPTLRFNSVMNLAVLSSTAAIMVLLKNEGAVLFAILVVAFVITCLMVGERPPLFKIALTGLIPLLLVLSWKYACAQAGITNDLARSDVVTKFFERAILWSNWEIIVKAMPKVFIGTGLAFVFIFAVHLYKKLQLGFLSMYVLVFTLLYATFLFLVYLSTPHDLGWHLGTSFDRTTLPLTVVLYGSVVFMAFSKPARSLKTRK